MVQMATDLGAYQAVQRIGAITPDVLPSSSRKIEESKVNPEAPRLASKQLVWQDTSRVAVFLLKVESPKWHASRRLCLQQSLPWCLQELIAGSMLTRPTYVSFLVS